VLSLYHVLQQLPPQATPVFFILLDVLIAFALMKLTRVVQGWAKKASADDSVSPASACLLYLWNPFSIMSCVSNSTALVNNLAVVLAFLFACKGRQLASMFWVALAGYWSLYPLILVIPLTLLGIRVAGIKSISGSIAYTFVSLLFFGGWLAGLLSTSFLLLNSWEFLGAYSFL